MGKFDSSKTRVQPVFDQLYDRDSTGRTWLPRLLRLTSCANKVSLPLECDFTIRESRWGDREKKLEPPVALLSWLIRHPEMLAQREAARDPAMPPQRRELLDGSESRMMEALELLRNNPRGERWHVFEGETQPDVFIATPSLVVVIEGKRTEREPTTGTTWILVRHQILRHLDCAWEIRGKRQVIGFFIVQGEDGSEEVPSNWKEFIKNTLCEESLRASLPHRGPEEQSGIAGCFAGATTWERVCREFSIDPRALPVRANH